MTYAAFENSTESGQPVEVYRFTIGSNSYFYTSAEDETISVGGLDYTYEDISRTRLGDGPEDRDQVLEITVPSSNAVAQQYVNIVPGNRAKVEVRRIQRNDTDNEVLLVFTGYIHSVSFKDNGAKAVIACQPVTAARSRVMPRFGYQSLCNNVLYDDICRADDTDPSFRLSGAAVTAVSGNVITVAGANGFTDGWFTGGYVETIGTTDYRMIIGHTGNDLTLHIPFPFDATTVTVNVLAGCDHSIATCKTKFNNVVNFAGFAYVPTRNPFLVDIA